MIKFIGWSLLFYSLWTIERVGINATSAWVFILGVTLLFAAFAITFGTKAVLASLRSGKYRR